jgi:hypothetical protein
MGAMNGRVHWPGTETATDTNGGIDGAIRSGERTAQEIVIAENRRRRGISSSATTAPAVCANSR